MIGSQIPRDEDVRLLRGQGRYTDDASPEGDLVLEFLRSPVAAAWITGLDVAAARNMPGVHLVVTQRELTEAGVGGLGPRLRHPGPDGEAMPVPPFPPLADGAVRYLGEPVVGVVADSRAAALDALEAVEVDFDEMPAVTDPLEAAAEGAPRVWDDLPSNHCFRFERGDRTAVDEVFAGAAVIVRRRLRLSRVTAVSLEPRTVRASYDAARFTLELGTQAPHRIAEGMAQAMGVPPERVRVIGRDCGGGFGMKNGPFREYIVALWAAREAGRPVRWRAARMEAFQSDDHARDQWAEAALALDADGHFLGLDVRMVAGLGAYLGPATPLPPVSNIGGMAGVYRFRAMHVTVDGMFTHTQPTSPYRGAGRPEATYVVERMADIAAREMGLDRAEIRRRNMIRPHEMPYQTALTFTYDCGDFPAVMEKALALGDWQGAERRRQASSGKGMLRGVGLCNAIEIAGGPLPAPAPEFADLRLKPDGTGWLGLGAADSGQGHRTTFRQVLADRLGLAPGEIEVAMADTDVVAKGTGTFGSRTAVAAGTSLWRAMDAIVDRLTEGAAEMLEVAREDLTFDRGVYRVTGTDRTIAFREVLARQDAPVAADHWGAADGVTFPNGCHVCEVEIDPETGRVTLDRYAVVDDVGTVINPVLVDGQIIGGAVQSIGQALMERIAYEPGSGQLLTASFMDYALPRADDVPGFAVGNHPVPTATNPLGVKGVGESGTVGALSAVMSAIADALAPLGIEHLDMPASPDRVWAAIQRARGDRADRRGVVADHVDPLQSAASRPGVGTSLADGEGD